MVSMQKKFSNFKYRFSASLCPAFHLNLTYTCSLMTRDRPLSLIFSKNIFIFLLGSSSPRELGFSKCRVQGTMWSSSTWTGWSGNQFRKWEHRKAVSTSAGEGRRDHCALPTCHVRWLRVWLGRVQRLSIGEHVRNHIVYVFAVCLHKFTSWYFTSCTACVFRMTKF